MRRLINTAWGKARSSRKSGTALLRSSRRRWPWLDHLVRAYRRYQDKRGDRLAAALTCYGFLSFFPLLALAYALLGYLVGVSDEARRLFVEAVGSLLPGLSEQLEVERIARSKTAAGLIGLAGLLFTGLGCVQVLREALHDIWDRPRPEGNFLMARLWDGAVLAFLGATLITGMAVTTLTTSVSHSVLEWLGLDGVTGAGAALRLLSLGMAIFFDAVVFLVLFSRLSGTGAPWRTIFHGALAGALGFELLKQLAALLLGNTTRNPVYASFAVLVGLMIWINLVSRFLLLVAAWTATRRAVLEADVPDDAPASTRLRARARFG
ncbi:YihY/virulence factor BrkB family protein [Actinomadura sp. SCN-SB]|uniref:YihY/virulence factor BrkB family protein n=1 Tax=Actinomadura sp. SCN-SB TaxID=3373092 RepID=UPI0037502C65